MNLVQVNLFFNSVKGLLGDKDEGRQHWERAKEDQKDKDTNRKQDINGDPEQQDGR